MRVLMVDDNPLDRELVREMLRGTGVLFSWAGGLRDGLAAAGDADVVLLDDQLPDGQGSQQVPAFRRHAPTARLVGLFSQGGEAVRDAFLAGGADAVMHKNDMLDEGFVGVLRGLGRAP